MIIFTFTTLGSSYQEVGCYKDKQARAITGGFVNFPSHQVIEKCYEKAKVAGNEYFAVQYNTECFTSSDAGETYDKYGRGDGCNNGRGGGWHNTVYKIPSK